MGIFLCLSIHSRGWTSTTTRYRYICRTSSSVVCFLLFFFGLLATRIHGFRLVACFYLSHSFPPPPPHLLSSSSCSSPSSTFSFSFPLFHHLTPLPPPHPLLLLSSLPPLPPPPPAPSPSTVPPLPPPPAPPPPLLASSSSSSSSPLLLLLSVMQYYCYTDPTIGRSQVPCEFSRLFTVVVLPQFLTRPFHSRSIVSAVLVD